MDVDSREDWLIRVEDTIVCGKIMGLHSAHCRVTFADASNPFAIAQLMHVNKKSLDEFPTVCVNSLKMAKAITARIGIEELSALMTSQAEPIELLLPAASMMPEILGDGFPYLRLRLFEKGIMNEIIAHVARPLALYANTMQNRTGVICQHEANDAMEWCHELQVPDAITIFYDAHRKPVVINSSGRSENDIAGIIGTHEVYEHRHISKILERNGISRYRPKTPMLMGDARQITLKRDMALRLGVLTFGKSDWAHDASIVKNLSPTGDIVEAAARLYSSLKAIDSIGLQLILVERLPDEGFGAQINERLRTVAFDVYQSNEILNMCS